MDKKFLLIILNNLNKLIQENSSLRTKNEKLEQKNKQLKQENEYLKKENQRLSIDFITGLKIRGVAVAKFANYLRKNIEKRPLQHHEYAIVMGDIDHFKYFNDTYGHKTGDDVLSKVGEILLETTWGMKDLVARYGGEEFLIILSDISKEEAFRKIE